MKFSELVASPPFGLSPPQLVQLKYEALKAQRGSYAPYSNFNVGSAILTLDGEIYQGANVENASYPVGICAERVAMAKLVSEGKRGKVVLVVGSLATSEEALEDESVRTLEFKFGEDYCSEDHGSEEDHPVVSPCGLCRQFLYEFKNTSKDETDKCNGLLGVIMLSDNIGRGERYCHVMTLDQLLPLGFGSGNLLPKKTI